MSTAEQALIDEIIADARKQAERLIRRAKQDAEKTRARAQKKAEREVGRILDQAGEAAALKKRALMARVEQEARKRDLRIREEIVLAVKDEAWQTVKRSTDDRERYCGILARLIAEAVASMKGDRFNVRLRKEDRALTENVLTLAVEEARSKSDREVKLTAAEHELDSAGGCIIESESGTEIVDQTFERRLARLWPEIRQMIGPVLFSDLKNCNNQSSGKDSD